MMNPTEWIDSIPADQLDAWFDNIRNVLETAYVAADEPWKQSGQSGPEERWTTLRRPIADCVDRDGDFLDIGCANGYLLECVVKWTAERGIAVKPYGLDISARLASMARERLALGEDRIFVGNCFNWTPPRRFDYVHTALVYVPGNYEGEYVRRLASKFLKPNGRILISNHGGEGGTADGARRGLLPGQRSATNLADRLEELRIRPIGFHDGFDTIKGGRIRVAIVSADGIQP